MFETIVNISEFEEIIGANQAVLAYFSTDECSVCTVLKPKVEELIVSNFPQIRAVYVNINQAAKLAAKYTIFTAPTVVMFLDNRELFRKSRHFGIHQLQADIERPYELLFS